MDTKLKEFFEGLGAGIDVPPKATVFPSMTSQGEKELLYRLGRQHYQGEGAIIDAGLFLGASTNAFGHGIRDNVAVYEAVTKRGFKPIHAFEIAIWVAAGFDRYLEIPAVKEAMAGEVYQDGESYLPMLKRLLAPHAELIDFKIGDIVKTAAVDIPVEIAFYDCLKNYERDWAAFKAFTPHFIPGHTVVIQQDYFFEDAIDNKIHGAAKDSNIGRVRVNDEAK